MQEKCIAPQCVRIITVKKHRLCQAHYMRFCRTGSTGYAPLFQRNKPGCAKPILKKPRPAKLKKRDTYQIDQDRHALAALMS